MATKRINPETGIVEQDTSLFGGLFGYDWQPAKNEEGRAERLNPETGTIDQDTSLFGGLFGRSWQPKK